MIYTIGCSLGSRSTVEDCLKYFENHEELQVDTETTGLDPHKDKITSLQIGDDDNQWFIDCRKINITLFKNLIESKRCILQNAKFDYKMLKAIGINLDRIYDTMLAECVLYCGYDNWGYGLDKLCERYLSLDLSKQERQSFLHLGDKEFTQAQIDYACKDVSFLSHIKEKQVLRIRHYNLEYCLDLENEVVKALGDIEYNGMILDRASWSKVTVLYKAKLLEIQKAMDDIVNTDPKLLPWKPEVLQGNLFGFEERHVKVNYASPIQIKKICHALGFMVDTTNESEIGKFAGLDDNGDVKWAKHPFIGELLRSRQTAKVVSTYGDSFLDYINPATGRVHTDFWQILNTGRVSSGGKKVNAPNLQNLPAKNLFRNCFKARPGFKWVSIDYSGQELRLMADGSGEKGFIDVLNTPGMDLHCYAGEMMFKRPIDKKKDKALRDKAKTINFGKPYGMGTSKLAVTLSISEKEAEDLFKLYAESFPSLNSWLEDQGKKAMANECSRTFYPCNRVRWFPDMKKAKALRKNVKKGDKATWREIMIIEGQTHRNGMNSPIQGSGADITKEALVEVRKLIMRYNEAYQQEVAFLICTVHDAIDVEVREDLAEMFAKEMEQIMVACGNKYVQQVRMEVDTTITEFWTK